MADEIKWDHQCRWTYGDLRCRNPVGLFLDGEHTGLCLFHRATPSGHAAAEIADESAIHDRESYLAAAKRQTYGVGDNPEIARLRAQIEASPNRRTGGSFAGLEGWKVGP